MERKAVFNTFISTVSYRDFLAAVFSLVENKVPSYVCFANVHMVVEARRDAAFQKVVNEANLVAPDGMPLPVFLRLAEGIKQERICGMDILPDLLRRAEALDRSVYFYGTTDELLEEIVQRAGREFPSLRIAGYYAPPFRSFFSKEESAFIVNRIRKAGPDLVLVALGCPKQEKWMAQHRDDLNACLLGLGQAFHVYAGREKRLPKQVRNLSLEWAYRLWHDPRRLWKRYACTNTRFLWLACGYMATLLVRRLSSAFFK